MAAEMSTRTYGGAIRDGFAYLLGNYPQVFVIGQGLWSPWYVGNSMTDLDLEFGRDRVMESPVSELACTGAAVGAAIAGRRPIVVHPRMDFMVLATDQIVTQAAKWSSMFAGRVSAPVVIRGIVNRGGEQGAQHSQALHAWFAHVPGLRVVMPATPLDARDLLVSACLCGDPVLYIDDRWLYERTGALAPDPDHNAIFMGPAVRVHGEDVTLVGAGYSAHLVEQAAAELAQEGVSAEAIDLRVVNPLDIGPVVASVERTGRLVVVDGGWTTCGLAGEVIASVVERLEPSALLAAPRRITLQDAPAPTSGPLEALYYPTVGRIVQVVREALETAPRAT
jgi:pyruvate dehydrogenase E1 component beta subunit